MDDKKFYSVPEVARRLKFTTKYIYDLVYGGQIVAEKINGRWRIPESEVVRREKRRLA